MYGFYSRKKSRFLPNRGIILWIVFHFSTSSRQFSTYHDNGGLRNMKCVYSCPRSWSYSCPESFFPLSVMFSNQRESTSVKCALTKHVFPHSFHVYYKNIKHICSSSEWKTIIHLCEFHRIRFWIMCVFWYDISRHRRTSLPLLDILPFRAL